MESMKKRVLFLAIFIIILNACSRSKDEDSNSSTFVFPESDAAGGLLVDKENGTVQWTFASLKYWHSDSPQVNGENGYSLQGDTLRFITHKGTTERPKVVTQEKIYGFGEYTWRVYVPMTPIGDRTSIGAFLYSDDQHEFDFEIGSGTSAIRKTLSALNSEMVVYITSQDNPWYQKVLTIQGNKWYTLSMKLKNVGGKYNVIWSIDGNQVGSVVTTFGSETPFYIFCSLENLAFIGDNLSSQDNYCLFDYVEYKPNI